MPLTMDLHTAAIDAFFADAITHAGTVRQLMEKARRANARGDKPEAQRLLDLAAEPAEHTRRYAEWARNAMAAPACQENE